MQDKPLVSVIMNCFNGEKYLDDAIKSVISQKYKKRKGSFVIFAIIHIEICFGIN